MQSERPSYPAEYISIRRNLLLASTTLILTCTSLQCSKDGADFNGLHFEISVEFVRWSIFSISLYEWILFHTMGRNCRQKWLRGDTALIDSYRIVSEISRRLDKEKIVSPKIDDATIDLILGTLDQLKKYSENHKKIAEAEIKDIRDKNYKNLNITSDYKETLNDLRNIVKDLKSAGRISDDNLDRFLKFQSNIEEVRNRISDIEHVIGELLDNNRLQGLANIKIDFRFMDDFRKEIRISPSIATMYQDTINALSKIRKMLKGIDRGIRQELYIFDWFPTLYFFASSIIFFVLILFPSNSILPLHSCAVTNSIP